MILIDNAEELALTAQETGADVIRGPVRTQGASHSNGDGDGFDRHYHSPSCSICGASCDCCCGLQCGFWMESQKSQHKGRDL